MLMGQSRSPFMRLIERWDKLTYVDDHLNNQTTYVIMLPADICKYVILDV